VSTTIKQEGSCKTAMIRVKKWRAGFSIKCLSFAQHRTLMVTPFNETTLQEELSVFCVGCPELLNNPKESK